MSGFAAALLDWYARSRRDLPWRASADPYRVWLSEIMLQQTRAVAAIPYYLRFLERFPTVEDLARAREDDVLAAWSGLGYYSRARNLHRAAREIATAGFPRDYEAIRALPGVGPYTAAAIASIAFGLPHAVVDGNVLRVIARLEDDAADIGSARTRARFAGIARSLLDRRRPGAYNQAIMELGATLCLPRAPQCAACPVARWCRARERGTTAQLPVKLRRVVPEQIDAELALVRRAGRVLLCLRPAGASRMAGFWELPDPGLLPGLRRRRVLGSFRHTITRHRYRFTVVEGALGRAPRGMRWFAPVRLAEIPLTTAARKALALAPVRPA